ncbi:MAG: 50S ribosomal protein L11 methyltransferase [Leptospira sp.]|nr:50S ribosomal protein L11 methyltransferase [Leptospira sp.]
MNYIELKVNLPKSVNDLFMELLGTLKVEGYYEILFDSSRPKKTNEILRDDTNISVYLNETDVLSELNILIFLKSYAGENYFLEKRNIETKDYEESYKEFYKPFMIGETLLLIPSWEKKSNEPENDSLKSGVKPLYLNPGLAFGTGHHETTKLMIRRLEKIIQKGDSILDVGTGSGILAIASALSGAGKVTALDIDLNSVRSAESNWKDNDNISVVDFKLFEGGFDHPAVLIEAYDLFLANITFAVISNNIKEIAKIKTSHFLFSGIISEKKDASFSLFKEHLGGNLIYIEELNDWLIIEWGR